MALGLSAVGSAIIMCLAWLFSPSGSQSFASACVLESIENTRKHGITQHAGTENIGNMGFSSMVALKKNWKAGLFSTRALTTPDKLGLSIHAVKLWKRLDV